MNDLERVSFPKVDKVDGGTRQGSNSSIGSNSVVIECRVDFGCCGQLCGYDVRCGMVVLMESGN